MPITESAKLNNFATGWLISDKKLGQPPNLKKWELNSLQFNCPLLGRFALCMVASGRGVDRFMIPIGFPLWNETGGGLLLLLAYKAGI